MIDELEGATGYGEQNAYPTSPSEFAARWNSWTDERRKKWLNSRIEDSEAAIRRVRDPVFPLLDERYKAADAYLAEGQTQLTDTELTPRVRTALTNAFAGGMTHQYEIERRVRAIKEGEL